MSNEITAPITIVRNVINAPVTLGVVSGGGEGGSTTFAGLTDKATADLPAINTPLATALSGKQPLAAVLTATTASFTTALASKLDGIEAGATAEHASNHAAGGTDPICYHSDTAPTTAEPGQKWLQTSTGREYEYFGGAWVEVASGPALDLSGYLTTEDTSTTGGANKIPKYDANGNLKLAPLRTIAEAGSGAVVNGGNLILTDRQMVSWHANASDGGVDVNSPTGDGRMLFRIRQDNNHPFETNFDAYGNICFYWGEGSAYKGMQFGNANGGAHYIYLHSGYASAGNTIRGSVPFAMNTMTWDGAASLLNRVVYRATALDASGTNSAWELFQNVTNLGSAQEPNGSKIVSVSKDGVWSAGTAPAFDVLDASGATITQTCSKYKTVQTAKVTLGGDRTLVISGAESGMRGVIYVAQDATGSRALTLPTNSAKAASWALSTAGAAIDRLSWEYDGTDFFWTISTGIIAAVDTDAADYIAATSATDTSAINTFIAGLKSMGLWSTSVCWALRSNQNYGTGTTLKSFGGLGSYDGTLTNGPTWGTAGITFDGVNDHIILPNPLKSTALASLTMFSVFASDQTTSRSVFGGFNSSSTGVAPSIWAGGQPLTTAAAANAFYVLSLDGTNTNATAGIISSGNTGAAQTSALMADASQIEAYANTLTATITPARATIWNDPTNWYMGMRGSGSYYFVGVQAFHMVSTTKLSSVQHTALRDLYKATLGAGLSLP